MEFLPTLTYQRTPRRFTIPQPVRLPFLLSLLFSALTTFLSVTLYSSLQPLIPLFYSLALPEQQVISKEFIFLLPAISVSIVIIHVLLARALSRADNIMMKIMSWSTVLQTALLFFIFIRVILII